MNLNKNTVSIWKHRNSIDFLTIYSYCVDNGIDVGYIFTGEPTHANCNVENKINEYNNLHNEIYGLKERLKFAEDLIIKLAKGKNE